MVFLVPAGARVRCAAHKPAASRAQRDENEQAERRLCHIAQADSTAPKHRHTDPSFLKEELQFAASNLYSVADNPYPSLTTINFACSRSDSLTGHCLSFIWKE